jgi:hypothetical protein
MKLGEQYPREVVGSSVIKRFDFQFHRAAEELLKLLQNSKMKAIFCEFHDDYVVEIDSEGKDQYKFKQVKTEDPIGDAWDFEFVFGLYKKAYKKDSKEILTKFSSSFGARLIQHFIDFPENCESVWLVGNVSFHKNLTKFLEEIKTKSEVKELSSENLSLFKHLKEASSLKDMKFADENFLFKCLKKFEASSIPATCLNSSLTSLKLKLIDFFDANPDARWRRKSIWLNHRNWRCKKTAFSFGFSAN